MTKHERLAEFMSHLGLSQDDMAQKWGISQTSVSNYLTDRWPKPDNLRMLKRAFPQLNIEWLEHGNGEMLEVGNVVNEAIPIYGKNKEVLRETQTIPLYDFQARAGLVSLFNDQARAIDSVRIPNLPRVDGAIYASGDSMYPAIKAGDMVIYRQITDLDAGIFPGEMYIITIKLEDEDITTIKYIQKSEKGSDWIKLVSHNEKHQSKDILLADVKALAMVRATVRKYTI